jgi:ribulose 1,5-bisphosphate synthetase/thiazole synthase
MKLKNIFFNLFNLLGFVNAREAFPGRIFDRVSDIIQSYDYVIVGGGLSGLVVANRLSEHPGR